MPGVFIRFANGSKKKAFPFELTNRMRREDYIRIVGYDNLLSKPLEEKLV